MYIRLHVNIDIFLFIIIIYLYIVHSRIAHSTVYLLTGYPLLQGANTLRP